MEHVLEVRGLVHRYGDHAALAKVDLTVESGECVVKLGARNRTEAFAKAKDMGYL